MKPVISVCPAEAINAVWQGQIEQWLSEAVARTNGKVHITDVYSDILEGKLSLWVAMMVEEEEENLLDSKPVMVGCAALRVHILHDKSYGASLDYIGGERLMDWLPEGFRLITTYLKKEFHCHGIDVEVRPGMEKMLAGLGFKKMSVSMHAKIEE